MDFMEISICVLICLQWSEKCCGVNDTMSDLNATSLSGQRLQFNLAEVGQEVVKALEGRQSITEHKSNPRQMLMSSIYISTSVFHFLVSILNLFKEGYILYYTFIIINNNLALKTLTCDNLCILVYTATSLQVIKTFNSSAVWMGQNINIKYIKLSHIRNQKSYVSHKMQYDECV